MSNTILNKIINKLKQGKPITKKKMIDKKLISKLIKQGYKYLYIECDAEHNKEVIPDTLNTVKLLKELINNPYSQYKEDRIIKPLNNIGTFYSYICINNNDTLNCSILFSLNKLKTSSTKISKEVNINIDIINQALTIQNKINSFDDEPTQFDIEEHNDKPKLRKLYVEKFGVWDKSHGWVHNGVFWYSTQCQCEYCQLDMDDDF